MRGTQGWAMVEGHHCWEEVQAHWEAMGGSDGQWRTSVEKMVVKAMADSPMMKKGLEKPREVDAFDADREVSRTNYGMVKGEVNEMGGGRSMNAWDPYKLGCNEMKGETLMPTDKSRGRVVNGYEDDVEGGGRGRGVLDKVESTSVLRGVLYEDDIKVDVVERVETKVVEGDRVKGENMLSSRITTILSPFKDGPITPKLEANVV
eukprot:Gb_20159 [translate_table: standard]